MTDVAYEVTGRIGRITLDRPARGNGITRRLASELERCVERADLDPAVHVLALAGNGRGFCGGYDLVQSAEGQGSLDDEDDSGPAPAGSPLDPAVMRANHDPAGTWDPMVDYAMMSRNVRAFMSLYHCSKPVVCKVHGFCVAGGTDMALCSDLLMIAAATPHPMDSTKDRDLAGVRVEVALAAPPTVNDEPARFRPESGRALEQTRRVFA